MKNPIEHLNKVFDSRIRLGIMSALMVNTEINFNELKELIEVTDGNLASHLKHWKKMDLLKYKRALLAEKQTQHIQSPRLAKKRLSNTWMHWSK